jgi:hypothetical protein
VHPLLFKLVIVIFRSDKRQHCLLVNLQANRISSNLMIAITATIHNDDGYITTANTNHFFTPTYIFH